MLKKKLKKAISIFRWLLTIALVLVVLLLIFTAFNPTKSFQVLRVMSGSMEPEIKVGSVVFVKKVDPEILEEGDVITYTLPEDPNLSVTHRLIAIEEKEGQTILKTRGDANNNDDIGETLPSQVKGKVIFSLPLLGYLSVWIREPLGFGLLVILPAILIIISEILNIKKTIEKEVEKKYAKQEKHQKNKPIGLLLIFFLLGISFFQIEPTSAYFSDVVVVEGNTFSMTSDWPSPPPTLTQVTINVDTDSSDDWGVLDTPNPGINPHSPEGNGEVEGLERLTQEQDVAEPVEENSEVLSGDETVNEEVDEGGSDESGGEVIEGSIEEEEETIPKDEEQPEETPDAKPEEKIEIEDDLREDSEPNQLPADESQEEPQSEEQPQEEAPIELTDKTDE